MWCWQCIAKPSTSGGNRQCSPARGQYLDTVLQSGDNSVLLPWKLDGMPETGRGTLVDVEGLDSELCWALLLSWVHGLEEANCTCSSAGDLVLRRRLTRRSK